MARWGLRDRKGFHRGLKSVFSPRIPAWVLLFESSESLGGVVFVAGGWKTEDLALASR